MGARLEAALEDYRAQYGIVVEWLQTLEPAEFDRPSVLDGWDVRTLVGHLLRSRTGLGEVLATRSTDPPVPMAGYVRAYRPAAAQISAATIEVTGDRLPDDLVDALRNATPISEEQAAIGDRTVLAGPRGPITALDWVITRVLDVVVHSDDLSRSLPSAAPLSIARRALATTVRALAEILAAQAPGRSVELRVPPFVAIQAIAGPRHTRGTPPNVIETEATTWLRLATGRIGFAGSLSSGLVRASGSRADLAPYLPVLG